MKIAFFGTPEFATPSLDALVASRHEVVLVVSRPDKPVGRRKVMTSPPVAVRARYHGLEVVQPKKIKSGPFPEALREAEVDAAAVVAYGRIISPELLEIPRLGMINVHPSLLPRHRGPSPIQWALACGDRFTGVSTMLLDEGMDTGPLLIQERIRIEEGEDADRLGQRLAVIGSDLLVRSLDCLEQGTIVPQPQASDGANVTPMLRREFGEVDWSMPAHQLVNRLRAFTPWPGLYTEFRGGRLKLFGLEKAPAVAGGDEDPGTVLTADERGIMVRCGRRTAVVITEVQREGRRRMPADAFLIGERVAAGERFG